MTRLMSVAYTADAVLERRKTVTRRKGWWQDKHGRRLLHVGDELTLCRKVMGRKPDEPLERLARVLVTGIRREPLRLLIDNRGYGLIECDREGFPELNPETFVDRYFVQAQGLTLDTEITRISWFYLDDEPA